MSINYATAAIVKMFYFSIRRSHQPFIKAAPIRVQCVLWDQGKEGGKGVWGQGRGEGELRDGELWGPLLQCQVKLRASSFSEQGDLLWCMFLIFMFFFCSDPAWRSWASSVLDWPKSSGCPHGHNCTDGLPVALAGQQQGVLISHTLVVSRQDWEGESPPDEF